MNKLITGLLLLSANLAWCQTAGTSGTITYEEKIRFSFNFGGPPMPGLDSLPKERKSGKTMLFTPEATLYQNAKKSGEENAVMDAPEGVQIMIVEPEDIIYSDVAEMKNTEQREFMTRTFLISSDLKRFQWKMTGNQKTIGSYPCMEARLIDTTKKVSAWFSPMIPVSSGPAGYGNLPGMILEIVVDDGDRVITAKSIDMKEVDKKLMVKPKKGKKVTREEFKAIVDEKTKENGGQGVGGQQMYIRITK